MADSLITTITASAAAVLAAGGLVFLSIAITNDRWWPQDPNAGKHSNLERWISGAVGCALVVPVIVLLFYSIRVDNAQKTGSGPSPTTLSTSVIELDRRVSELEDGTATVARLAGLSTEIRTLRAGAMAGDPSGSTCAHGPVEDHIDSSASTVKAWVNGAKTPCDRMKNNAWTVEIAGDLYPYVGKLLAGLRVMKIPYVVGPPQRRYTMSKGEGIPFGVGMVFDADAPADLICRIEREYVAATTRRWNLRLPRIPYWNTARLQQPYRDLAYGLVSTFELFSRATKQ